LRAENTAGSADEPDQAEIAEENAEGEALVRLEKCDPMGAGRGHDRFSVEIAKRFHGTSPSAAGSDSP
jgi:hypothetical protein